MPFDEFRRPTKAQKKVARKQRAAVKKQNREAPPVRRRDLMEGAGPQHASAGGTKASQGPKRRAAPRSGTGAEDQMRRIPPNVQRALDRAKRGPGGTIIAANDRDQHALRQYTRDTTAADQDLRNRRNTALLEHDRRMARQELNADNGGGSFWKKGGSGVKAAAGGAGNLLNFLDDTHINLPDIPITMPHGASRGARTELQPDPSLLDVATVLPVARGARAAGYLGRRAAANIGGRASATKAAITMAKREGVPGITKAVRLKTATRFGRAKATTTRRLGYIARPSTARAALTEGDRVTQLTRVARAGGRVPGKVTKASLGANFAPAVAGQENFSDSLRGDTKFLRTLQKPRKGNAFVRGAENLVADVLGLPAATIPALFLTGDGILQGIKSGGKDWSHLEQLYEGWKATDAFGGLIDGISFKEFLSRVLDHPGYTALEVAGGYHAVGKSVGAAGRAGMLGAETQRRYLRTTREALPAVSGVEKMAFERRYSDNPMTARRQRRNDEKIVGLANKRVREGQKSLTRREKVRLGIDEIRSANTRKYIEDYAKGTMSQKQASDKSALAKVVIKAEKAVGEELMPAVLMVGERVLRPEHGLADVTKAIKHYEAEAGALRGSKADYNLQRRESLEYLRDNPKKLEKVYATARDLIDSQRPLERAMILRGIIDQRRAERARAIPEREIHRGPAEGAVADMHGDNFTLRYADPTKTNAPFEIVESGLSQHEAALKAASRGAGYDVGHPPAAEMPPAGSNAAPRTETTAILEVAKVSESEARIRLQRAVDKNELAISNADFGPPVSPRQLLKITKEVRDATKNMEARIGEREHAERMVAAENRLAGRDTPDHAPIGTPGEHDVWVDGEPVGELKHTPTDEQPGGTDTLFLSQQHARGQRAPGSSHGTIGPAGAAKPKVGDEARTGRTSREGSSPADAAQYASSNDFMAALARDADDAGAFYDRAVYTGEADNLVFRTDNAARDFFESDDPAAQALKVRARTDERGSDLVPVRLGQADRYQMLREQLDNGEFDMDALTAINNGIWSEMASNVNVPEGTRWGIARKDQLAQAAEHRKPLGGTEAMLEPFMRAFKAAVLPWSPNWYLGNWFDISMRAFIGGQPPPPFDRLTPAGRMGKRLIEHGEGDLLDPVHGIGGPQMFGHERPLAQETTWWHKQNRILRPEARGILRSIFELKEGGSVRKLRNGVERVNSFLFHVNAVAIESSPGLARAGRIARRELREANILMGRSRKDMETGFDDYVNGLRNTPAQAAFARQIHDLYGNWIAMSPKARSTMNTFVPFYTWMRAATRFVFVTMPIKHPTLQGILAANASMTEIERRQLGLFFDPFHNEGSLPSYRQGSGAIGGGRLLPVSRINSFGVFGSVPGAFTSFIAGPAAPLYQTGLNVDFKGDKIVDSDGNELTEDKRIGVLGLALAEMFMPAAAMAEKIYLRGRWRSGFTLGGKKSSWSKNLLNIAVPPSKIVSDESRKKAISMAHGKKKGGASGGSAGEGGGAEGGAEGGGAEGN